MAPRTHIKKRRESALTDQYTEDLHWHIDDVSEALFLVNKIEQQMDRIVRFVRTAHNDARFNHYMDHYRELKTVDLPLAEVQYRQAVAQYQEYMYMGLITD